MRKLMFGVFLVALSGCLLRRVRSQEVAKVLAPACAAVETRPASLGAFEFQATGCGKTWLCANEPAGWKCYEPPFTLESFGARPPSDILGAAQQLSIETGCPTSGIAVADATDWLGANEDTAAVTYAMTACGKRYTCGSATENFGVGRQRYYERRVSCRVALSDSAAPPPPAQTPTTPAATTQPAGL